jgi:UDP-3-O-[3-hydroxymyristoyl] glucosamine N-acyltransferase
MNSLVLDIFNDFKEQGLLTAHQGPNNTITGMASVQECGAGHLVFVDKPAFIPKVKANQPACVVTTEKLAAKFEDEENLAILIAPNVSLALALMRQKYCDRDLYDTEWPTIHPSAIIHETASLGEGTLVGPGVVIGADVIIGDHCAIMAGCVIEYQAKIGNHTIIHPNTTIGYSCELGEEVIVHSGSVIGSEGYGFAQTEKRKSHRIPQTGVVIIEDRVRIGANNCIDRAAFDETRIKAGTKLDNLCHIAHGVTIGQDCLLTAGLIVAGSTTLGDRVMASGSTGIINHLNICSDVVLVHRAGVTKDITTPGLYAGLPLQPMAEYTKNMAALKKLGEMRQQIRDLTQKVETLEKNNNR